MSNTYICTDSIAETPSPTSVSDVAVDVEQVGSSLDEDIVNDDGFSSDLTMRIQTMPTLFLHHINPADSCLYTQSCYCICTS